MEIMRQPIFIVKGEPAMQFYFAPLEGVTGYQFRTLHHRFFPGVDKYFTPFLATNQNHKFGAREMRELLPEHNAGLTVVPQLLSRVAEDFLWAANLCGQLGYTEVNLNLGCPSGTVAAKGKGSGFLSDPDALSRFLDLIYSRAEIAVSIKTRLGGTDPEEFPSLLALFNRYPVSELIIHPRVRTDFYRHPVRLESFAHAVTHSHIPVCYNGDLVTAGGYACFTARFPTVARVMLGRGLIGDPALLQKLRGEPLPTRDTLRAFHDALFEAYLGSFGRPRHTVCHMKEVWFYLLDLFEGGSDLRKALHKAASVEDYRAFVAGVFRLPLREDSAAGWLPSRPQF